MSKALDNAHAWNPNNDGEGSGLNADLVRGVNVNIKFNGALKDFDDKLIEPNLGSSIKKLRAFYNGAVLLTNNNELLYISGYAGTNVNYIAGKGNYTNSPGQTGLITNGFDFIALPYRDATIKDFQIVGGNGIAVLYENGELWVSGYNGDGELGLGDTTARNFFTLSQTGVVELLSPNTSGPTSYSSYGHLHILKDDGHVYATGYNDSGYLGDGTTTTRNSFVQSLGLPLSFNTMKIYKNQGFGTGVFVVIDNKEIYATGHNGTGALGDGTTTNVTSFKDVTSNWNPDNWNIIEIYTTAQRCNDADTDTRYNNQSTAVIISNGATWRVLTSGHNGFGQLGDGTTTNNSTPQVVFETTIPIKQALKIDSINGLVLLLENGDLYAWGYNGFGQLGTGDTTNITSPTKIATDVELILNHAQWGTFFNDWRSQLFIKKTDGYVYVTGHNSHGQLGVGDMTDRASFTKIVLPRDVQNKIIKAYEIRGKHYGKAILLETDDYKSYVTGYNGEQMIFNSTATNVVSPILVKTYNKG